METGFVLTPFLPGDSLIFIAGVFAANNLLNIFILFILISLASILGDTLNYWVGKFFGERTFSKFIKKEHMDKTKKFYEEHGAKTIIFARFVPIVRTLAPFIAGVGEMKYIKFLKYNIIGGLSWVAVFLFTGYFFGTVPFVEKNLTLIIILIIIVSILPTIYEIIKEKRKNKSKNLNSL
jgi:membrane-associated protein